jgi:hypothetical protein
MMMMILCVDLQNVSITTKATHWVLTKTKGVFDRSTEARSDLIQLY